MGTLRFIALVCILNPAWAWADPCHFQKVAKATKNPDIAIVHVPWARGAGIIHSELEVQDQMWNNYLGFKNYRSTAVRRRMGQFAYKWSTPFFSPLSAYKKEIKKFLGIKPYRRYVLDLNPIQIEGLKNFLEEHRDEKALQTCIWGSCRALTEGAGVHIPLIARHSPFLNMLWLEWKHFRGELVKSRETVGPARRRNFIMGGISEIFAHTVVIGGIPAAGYGAYQLPSLFEDETEDDEEPAGARE